MAQRFYVKLNEMGDTRSRLADLGPAIDKISSDVEAVRGNMGISAISADRVQRSLKIILSNCDGLKEHMGQMADKLEMVIQLYSSCESKITDQTQITVQELNPEEPGEGGPYQYDYEVDPDIWDYLMDSLEQIILGNFTDECNFLGIVGSVLAGCIPYLGQVCDARDIIADIYHLFEDGPETAEWISLGIDIIALIPLCDLLKYSDEAAGILKYADEAIGGLIDYTRGTWKYADEVFTKLDDVIQEGADWTASHINKVMDFVNNDRLGQQAYKSLAKAYQFAQKEIGTATGGEIVKDILLESIHLKDKFTDGAAGIIDGMIDSVTGDSETPAHAAL